MNSYRAGSSPEGSKPSLSKDLLHRPVHLRNPSEAYNCTRTRDSQHQETSKSPLIPRVMVPCQDFVKSTRPCGCLAEYPIRRTAKPAIDKECEHEGWAQMAGYMRASKTLVKTWGFQEYS